MAGSADEKRGFIRVPFCTEVHVQAQGVIILSCEGIDLSLNGIRLATSNATPAAGTSCRVKIFLQASGDPLIIEAKGEMIRSGPGIAAIEFKELDLDSYNHLRQLILNNTDDPEKAELEFIAHWGIREPR